MDAILHCNAIKCRAECVDQAVVTTCSHIFCLQCAADLGLNEPKDGHRKCPACSAPLNLADDAVCTSLNPTEDYKTSILSGLSPTVIMDCVGRGLGFWSYQMAQEINYQVFLGKTLTERYRIMSINLDSTLRQANEDSQRLNEKIDSLSMSLDEANQRNQKLEEKFQAKSIEFNRKVAAYQKLMHQSTAAGVEIAAEQHAEHVIQAAAARPQPHDPQHHIGNHRAARQNSDGGAGIEDRRRRMTLDQPGHNFRRGYDNRAGHGTSHSYPITNPVSANRTPLPNAKYPKYGANVLANLGGQPFRRTTSTRENYQTVDHGYSRTGGSPANGQGLSSNIRMGRPQPQFAPQNRMYSGNRPLDMNIR